MEIWKDIKEYKDLYKISCFGNVKALVKKAGSSNRKEKILKKQIDEHGYYYILLSKNNKKKRNKISRLVASAFISNPENKPYVNHLDGNKKNDFWWNLEWCTQSENIKHAFRIGLANSKGENHPQNKLTNKDIFFIRENKDTYKQKELSEMFNVTVRHIRFIINNKRWNHI